MARSPLQHLREIPDPASLGLDWPDLALARADVERLRGRLTEQSAALGALREQYLQAEEADKAARRAAAKAGEPMPSPTVAKVEQDRVQAQQHYDALEGALQDAYCDLRDTIAARLDDLLDDAAQLVQQRRDRYARAVESLAEARASLGEAEGLATFLAGFPDARYKPGTGYLRNAGGDVVMWEPLLTQLRADALPVEQPSKPAYAVPLHPTLREIGVSGTPNMERPRQAAR
jgi:hypothetical protein